MLSYMVVDDEPLARERIIIQISHRKTWQLVAESGDLTEALELLEVHQPDVCFIDLNIINGNGLDIAAHIAKTIPTTKIIFVTGCENKAIEAFSLNAIDYLLKPVGYDRMEKCLDKIEASTNSKYHKTGNSQHPLSQIAVKSLGKIELINIEDIYWIHGASNYVELHLANRVVLHREKLSILEAQLNPENFVRVHRSSIVSINKIKLINSEEGRYSLIDMQNGNEIRISNAYRKTFFAKLGVGI